MPPKTFDLSGVAEAFVAACRAELSALKPGNVHKFRDGHGMTVATFERAAEVAAVRLVAGTTVGERIEGATRASLGAVGLNANLGIVLLCAPLAHAALNAHGRPLKSSLDHVLKRLTVEDAEAAYRAIAAANPGGLGRTDEHDVAEPPRITLLEAMAAAAGRDRIAQQYVSGFEDVFAAARAYRAKAPGREAVEDLYLGLLALFPDSHVARKFGAETAEALRREAAAFSEGLDFRADRERALDAFDLHLKARGLNPGTTADLTVAALFTAALLEGPKAHDR
ncbi:triphosphoribosyl-dephospho-CoA synthase [Chenggangzhangella methanolivorans]|uniref:Triphosphoribosyl-dephospho-CoA synthase n=1 Tax=Chenggangzhangella methanolivorans TaxID=1437009 RepID=A0A9E6R8U6_9HYPH|nr:triphosphoribosyl-dephospho-CoA synthase [Chenggangzhangella methanolivorans]QZN99934.1 triphosphoribosyl-dephospho-CoA synthase [Chenggangzhangella methanolivorans]